MSYPKTISTESRLQLVLTSQSVAQVLTEETDVILSRRWRRCHRKRLREDVIIYRKRITVNIGSCYVVPSESHRLRSVADESALQDVGRVVGDDGRRCRWERGLLEERTRLEEDVVREEIAHGGAHCDATAGASGERQRRDDGVQSFDTCHGL